MPIPDYQVLMLLPTLQALSDGMEVQISEVRTCVAEAAGLTSDDLQEMMPGGHETVFTRWISRALRLMGYANLLRRVRQGVYQLTEEGKELLAKKPARIDIDLLRTYPKFVERELERSKKKPNAPPRIDESASTPKRTSLHDDAKLSDSLEAEILERVREVAPSFFEQVVLDLLIAMGYGTNSGDAAMGHVTGRSGDGGVDGTIKEDVLGLNEIYFQAKRYADGNVVGENDVRNFAGALDAASASNGVFVTTATFTRSAKNYVKRSPKRIGLIDGKELARLMVKHDIGVRIHEIKRINEDYFEGDADRRA